MPIVVLVGFMGSGKSSVGRKLARFLGTNFIDSDVKVEQRLGMTIADAFRRHGEHYFRKVEADTIERLLQEESAVIALGGGSLENEGTLSLLQNLFVAYLDVSFCVSMDRIKGDVNRPLVQSEELESRYLRRLGAYSKWADVTYDADRMTTDQIAAALLMHLREGNGRV
ncbi:MAG: shikimate kinase [Actinomycetota bacterium]|nr:shikimate kinase [Actinomycetota bacterium]